MWQSHDEYRMASATVQTLAENKSEFLLTKPSETGTDFKEPNQTRQLVCSL